MAKATGRSVARSSGSVGIQSRGTSFTVSRSSAGAISRGARATQIGRGGAAKPGPRLGRQKPKTASQRATANLLRAGSAATRGPTARFRAARA